MQKEAQVVSEHAIDFATLSAHDQLLLIIGKVHGHDTGVQLGFVSESPCTARQVYFLNLAVATTYKEHLLMDTTADDTVRSEWH